MGVPMACALEASLASMGAWYLCLHLSSVSCSGVVITQVDLCGGVTHQSIGAVVHCWFTSPVDGNLM